MLDDLKKISELDKGGILSSIERLPEQIQDAWRAVQYLDLSGLGSCENIIVAGMGGSALGARIVRSLEFKNLRAPIEIVNGYYLPNYVNEKSLVILSSYSGGTEETISCAHDAIKRKAKIVGVATGGKLVEVLHAADMPLYIINPANNPSGQPRMGLGYSIASVLAILSKLKYMDVTDEDINGCVDATNKFVKDFGVRARRDKNDAKRLAEKLAAKAVFLISSEHLAESAHAFKNQVNENAKTMSAHFEISELNHHLMEGLKYPHKAREVVHFLFIESDNYFDRIKKRYPITQEVIKENGFGFDIYKTTSKKKIEEIFEILTLGSYISFYIAMIHGINPTPIPWVDYFKKKME